MRIIQARNVHGALPLGLEYIQQQGIPRESRNGPVLVSPWPVTTIYTNPCERVLFWPQRDANPFFHLYESLWMLAGRNNVAPLVRYVKRSTDYSDDGKILHGAYGYRWRHFPLGGHDKDQLAIIAERLKKNPEDRRCVLQMWDCTIDLMTDEDAKTSNLGKDFPCNTIATFQRGSKGELNLVVFCRSNDIIWGCYGANAVQFSMLLEYMARWIGCQVGTYSQISVNYHAYLDTLQQVKDMPWISNPYSLGIVRYIPMSQDHELLDGYILDLLNQVDTGFQDKITYRDPFFEMADTVLRAHHLWKTLPAPQRYTISLDLLNQQDSTIDWVVASREWIERRYIKWQQNGDKK